MLFPRTHTNTGPRLGPLSPSLLSVVIKRRVVIRVSFGEVTFSPLCVFPLSFPVNDHIKASVWRACSIYSTYGMLTRVASAVKKALAVNTGFNSDGDKRKLQNLTNKRHPGCFINQNSLFQRQYIEILRVSEWRKISLKLTPQTENIEIWSKNHTVKPK